MKNTNTTSRLFCMMKTMLIIRVSVPVTSVCADIFSRKCSDFGTFKHLVDHSLATCAEECHRRQRCQVFMFRHIINYCELKEDINIDVLDKEEPLCTYYAVEDWPIYDIGRCQERPCNLTERCETITAETVQCVKSECLRSAEIDNAKVLSNTYDIGTTNRYKCKGLLSSKGNPKIKCLKNATWSATDFQCLAEIPPEAKMHCPALQKHYVNADLMNVIGNGAAGTIFIYKCRDGYTKNDTQKAQVTCQHSGLWDNDFIRCCNVNSTHYFKNGCVAFVDDTTISKYTEADDYCKSINGTLTSPTINDFVYFYKARYILLHQKKSWVIENWNYDKCAKDNSISVDPELTFRQKIDEVRYGGLKGDHCWWGNQFHIDEPDQDFEDCMLRDRESDFKIRDYECNYLPYRYKIGIVCGFNTSQINI